LIITEGEKRVGYLIFVIKEIALIMICDDFVELDEEEKP